MRSRKLAEVFLRKANQDLVVLEKWRSDPDIAAEILGFHAQQVAEKLLKAALASSGIEFPPTHRLDGLIDLGRDHGIAFPEGLEEIRFLTPFAVEFRYGLYDDTGEPFDAERAFTLLTELYKWADAMVQR